MKIDIEKYQRMKVARDFFKDLGNVYFVGGCIRDILLNDDPKDFDLITDVLPEEVQAYIKSKGKRCLLIGARYGTMACKLDGEVYEITTYRKEQYTDGSRKPVVEYTKDIKEDLKRRDFTINTLVCDMNGEVKDYLGGVQDLKNKVLKAVGVAKHRFKEDPLRILRGIRFKAKYKLELEKLTGKRLKACRWELLKISRERIVDEINKMLLLTPISTKTAILDLFELKMFQIICPPMQLQYKYEQNSPYHDFPLHIHSAQVVHMMKHPVGRIENSLPHLWAGLLHDIAKPFTRVLHKSGERCNYIGYELIGAQMADDFCRNYKFSNKDREFIVESIKGHLIAEQWMKKFDDAGKKRDINIHDLISSSMQEAIGHPDEDEWDKFAPEKEITVLKGKEEQFEMKVGDTVKVKVEK